ncbi:hypothetical protein LZ31DRAFT_565093 [Colletotrichum somersetense]|nr:hypothetical protein LZ31DRAFT_565093 [Colletotrichum somersetense]
MPEIRAEQEPVANNRKLTVRIDRSIHASHGGRRTALFIALNRIIRVPDNNDANSLPPRHGAKFPLFRVRDYAHKMPEDMARKGGIFFPMYQREAMWIDFFATAPFAIKIYVGGVNAVSGFPMTENDKTRVKRLKMLGSGRPIQDYVVVPAQRWLDGIVSEDSKIRQSVPQPKGSGFSVEAQVTGDEKVGGIQIEFIPIKKEVSAEFNVRYEKMNSEAVTRPFNLAEKGLTAESTWGGPFGDFRGNVFNLSGDTKLGDAYFPPNFSTLSVRINPRCANLVHGVGSPWLFRLAVATPEITETDDADEAEVKEMGLAAGGLIKQTIEADTYPADIWDVEASVMLNLQILDVGSFSAVTGLPAPNTPVDAESYARRGYPVFAIWGGEKSGIKGDFSEVKSVAQMEAERARAEGRAVGEEESVPMRVVDGMGGFTDRVTPPGSWTEVQATYGMTARARHVTNS